MKRISPNAVLKTAWS